MYKFALIGCDIGYTSSPVVHEAVSGELGIDISFEVCDIGASGLEATVTKLFDTVDGIFVTKPYKNDIKRYLDKVNTRSGVNVVRCADKSGFNTDGIGFLYALDRAFDDWRSKVRGVLVLCSGGAARSVAEALADTGKSVYVLNRDMVTAAKMCRAFGIEQYYNQPAELIVNCTSAGSDGEDILKALCVSPEFEYAYDLIYYADTPFMQRTAAAGAKVSDGKAMLVYQAIEGEKLLTGVKADTLEVFERAFAKLDGKF